MSIFLAGCSPAPARRGHVDEELGCSVNLYRRYVIRPESITRFVAAAEFSFVVTRTVERWNAANVDIAVRAVPHRLAGGKAVLEICDGTDVPTWIIYAVGPRQWQADEFTGKSFRASSLAAALDHALQF